MSAILFSSVIGPVSVDCCLSENHTADLEITEIPVEDGSAITDHAVRRPNRVTLEIATENAAASYSSLTSFQKSRVPFTLVTGLSVYRNMLVKSVNAQRDAMFSNVLKATVDLQEVIIVATAHAAGGADGNAPRGKPGGAKSTRSAAPSANRSPAGPAADRASGTTQRGDAVTKTSSAQDRSIMKQLMG